MEKKKRVTLVDLAACCGLSKTAVGAILSHDPKYKVSPETKDMVLALARKMDYKPNLAAKALVSRKHYTVGMLFYSVKDRCYSEIMAAAQQKLAEKGYASLFAFWEDSDFMSAFNMLADHGVDGIITNAPEELAQTLPADMPVVLYGFSSQTRDAVLVDRRAAVLGGGGGGGLSVAVSIIWRLYEKKEFTVYFDRVSCANNHTLFSHVRCRSLYA